MHDYIHLYIKKIAGYHPTIFEITFAMPIYRVDWHPIILFSIVKINRKPYNANEILFNGNYFNCEYKSLRQ